MAYPSTENEDEKWERQSENHNLMIGIYTEKPDEFEKTEPSV